VATEAAALRLAHELAPRHVPAVLLYDKAASIMVCDFLEGCQDMTSLIRVRGRAGQLVSSRAGAATCLVEGRAQYSRRAPLGP
jgi:hypothetical protein